MGVNKTLTPDQIASGSQRFALPARRRVVATDYLITSYETIEFLCPTWAASQGPSSEEADGIPVSVNGAAAVDSRVVTTA